MRVKSHRLHAKKRKRKKVPNTLARTQRGKASPSFFFFFPVNTLPRGGGATRRTSFVIRVAGPLAGSCRVPDGDARSGLRLHQGNQAARHVPLGRRSRRAERLPDHVQPALPSLPISTAGAHQTVAGHVVGGWCGRLQHQVDDAGQLPAAVYRLQAIAELQAEAGLHLGAASGAHLQHVADRLRQVRTRRGAASREAGATPWQTQDVACTRTAPATGTRMRPPLLAPPRVSACVATWRRWAQRPSDSTDATCHSDTAPPPSYSVRKTHLRARPSNRRFGSMPRTLPCLPKPNRRVETGEKFTGRVRQSDDRCTTHSPPTHMSVGTLASLCCATISVPAPSHPHPTPYTTCVHPCPTGDHTGGIPAAS